MDKHKLYVLTLLTICLLLGIATESVSQVSADSVAYPKHQIGFNATKSIRLFENASGNSYAINYRYKLNSVTSLRSGLNYNYDSSDGGELKLDLKVGIDKQFEQSKKWRFYSGVDLIGGVRTLSNSTRKTYKMGLSPFLGAIYYLDEHFSISTEPGLLVQINHFKNDDSFNPENSENWFEMKLVNVGQIIIGIHF